MDFTNDLAGEIERELMLPDPTSEAQDDAEPAVDNPLSEIEREIQQHQDAVAQFMQRAADARKAGRTAVAALQEQVRQSKARAAEEQRRLADSIAKAKEATEEEIATAFKLAAGRRAALEALQS